MAARPRRRLLVAGALVLVAVAAYLAYPYAVVAYLRAAILDASSAAAETEALCRTNHWVHRGLAPTYSVATRDGGGNEVRPWTDGRYDRVAVVTITWTTGASVERVLLSHDGLDCLFGE